MCLSNSCLRKINCTWRPGIFNFFKGIRGVWSKQLDHQIPFFLFGNRKTMMIHAKFDPKWENDKKFIFENLRISKTDEIDNKLIHTDSRNIFSKEFNYKTRLMWTIRTEINDLYLEFQLLLLLSCDETQTLRVRVKILIEKWRVFLKGLWAKTSMRSDHARCCFIKNLIWYFWKYISEND